MALRSEAGKSPDTSDVPVFNARVEPALVFALAVGIAVIILGGYGLNWHWTGFKDNNTLWDWLRLTILPIVLGVVAFWLRAEGRQPIKWRWWWFALVLVAATVLLVGGYGLHWAWTGFAGNKLWDWLHLLALPIVLVLLPSWMKLRTSNPLEWRLAVGAAILIFTILTIGGYALNWTWTGFAGNQFWDWMDLLLVPFLVPIVFIYIRTRMENRRTAAARAGRLDRRAGRRGGAPLPRLTGDGWIGAPPASAGDGRALEPTAVRSEEGDRMPCPHCGRTG